MSLFVQRALLRAAQDPGELAVLLVEKSVYLADLSQSKLDQEISKEGKKKRSVHQSSTYPTATKEYAIVCRGDSFEIFDALGSRKGLLDCNSVKSSSFLRRFIAPEESRLNVDLIIKQAVHVIG